MLYARLLQQTLAGMIFSSLGVNVVPIGIENTDAGLFSFRDIFIQYILVRAPHASDEEEEVPAFSMGKIEASFAEIHGNCAKRWY